MELLNTILDLLGKAPIQVVLLILGVAFLLLGLGLKTPWGQITDKKLRWVGVVFGGIFVIASLLCIFAFDCGAGAVIEPTPEVTETVPPGEETPTTETPAPTDDFGTLSDGAQFLAFDYFGGLNDEVKTEDDIEHYWNLLSKDAKKAYNKSDFDKYQTQWWGRRVQFKLHECSATEFVLDLYFFDRDDVDYLTITSKTEDMKYTLIQSNGDWLIDGATSVSDVGHFCDLVYEN
jgi:hypothetical protein